MPSQSFFNLPEDKKQKIIDCAFKEFSENTYDKASIFLIAKNAQISRTSIYFYFKDKQDIYKYLIKLLLKPHIDQIKTMQENVTIHYLATSLFEYYLNFYKTDKQNFVSNMLKNMNPFNITFITDEIRQQKIKNSYKKLMYKDDIKIENDNDITILSFTIMSNLSISILKYFADEISKQQAKDHFYRTLQIVENGIKKE